MVRYADDFVTLCDTEEEAKRALTEVKQWMTENGLALHPDKTHIGNCTVEGEGFEFLGYRFTFNACDFEQRVVAAASKLGLVEANELNEDETRDLVSLAAQGVIDEPESRLGRYLQRNWERVATGGRSRESVASRATGVLSK